MKTWLKKNPIPSAIAALLLLLGAGVALILAYADREMQRDLQGWQLRLGIAAESQFQAVDKWIDGQYLLLQELADNASLRFYLMQLGQPGMAGGEEPAQLSYLRNLLTATAERNGYLDNVTLSASVGANLPVAADQGLALFSADGRLVVATAGFQVEAETVALVRQVLQAGQSRPLDLALNRRGEAVLGFAVPVVPIHAAGPGAKPVGVVFGLRRARDTVYPLLTRRLMGLQEETLIVRGEDGNIVYLTPLADGTPPLKKRLLRETKGLDAAYALASPGTFSAGLTDDQGNAVLMTSRAFKRLPWVLVYRVGADEALAEARDHQRFLLTSLLLASLMVAAALVAAWRHGSGVRAAQTAAQLREQSQRLERQANLLQSITDHTSEFISILGGDGRIIFANPSLAAAVGAETADLAGKTLSNTLGAEPVHRLKALLDATQASHAPGTALLDLEIGEALRTYHCTAVPLEEDGGMARILLVLHDVTAIQAEQQRRSSLLRQLIATLMRAVDLHDPHCAHHSERTAQVAVAIGQAMALGDDELATLEMAGQLANVGKLFVPKEILMKTDPLTDGEMAILRQHVDHAMNILSGLEFEGRVLETIAEKHEYLDGTGYPRGLGGEQMLLTGKVLAVANAFVAMVSARAYRPGMGVDAALDSLLDASRSKYDRNVVAALFHVAALRNDWKGWALPAGE